jgi:hypothetical protein
MDSTFKSKVGDKPQTRATRDPTACRAVALLCAALAVIALCAPLLVTLPRTLDSVVTPMSVVGKASASESSTPEQSPAKPAESWVDPFEEGELAQWRMRASD